MFITLGPSIDASNCFGAVWEMEGLRNFRIKQDQPNTAPEQAEVDYYFDVDGERYRLFFTGTIESGTPYWVGAMAPPLPASDTVSGIGVPWSINKVKGKGSKSSCADGTLSYTIVATRTG